MSNVLTSERLINSVKRRAMIPQDQNTFTDDDFLDMLNEELNYFGITHLLSTYEEYLVTFIDFPLVSGQSEYEIPSRAIGNKLRGLFFVDTSDYISELARVSLEDLPLYSNSEGSYGYGTTSTFYVRENTIILNDELPFTDGFLRMYFYLKPNKLVSEDRIGVITDINTTTGVITLSEFPDNFAIENMDFIKAKSPNKIFSFDKMPTAINSVTKTVTFDPDDLPELLAVGDYLCLAGETPVPQLPEELHAILAQRVAVAALEALGDEAGVVKAQARLEMMEKSALTLIDNRVESSTEKIHNRNSPLQQATIGGYGYGRRGRGF